MQASDAIATLSMLISGVALVASWRSFNATDKQASVAIRTFDDNRKSEQQRTVAKQRALRVALIPVLHEAAQWASDVVRSLAATPVTGHGEYAGGAYTIIVPRFQPEYAQAFMAVIEASQNDAVSMRLARTLSNLQVVTARLRGFNERSLGTIPLPEKLEYLKDATVVYAQAVSLLQWADGRDETVSFHLTKQDLHAAIRPAGLNGGLVEELRDLINRRREDWDPEKF